MHIHWNMFGYANAGWESRSLQTGAMVQPGAGGDGDGDADGSAGGANATDGAGANPILQALAQALESLGLSLESNSTTPTASTTSGSAAPANSTSGGATPVTDPVPSTASTTAAAAQPTSSDGSSLNSHEIHAIARDIRHVMRALFTDIQAENTLAPASSATSSATTASPQSSFGSGLAALISQIQGGSVPANLAAAFDKLVRDLERIGGSTGANGAPVTQQPGAATAPVATTSAPTTSAPTTSAPTASAPTTTPATTTPTTPSTSGAGGVSYQGLLLQFLTNLQSDLGLGYGTSSSATARGATTGVMVNTLA